MSSSLATWSTTRLLASARTRREQAVGSTITFSPKAFFPLTMLCRDRCGYCTFAKAPARIEQPYLTHEQVQDLAQRALALGATEALFTLGEQPEDRYAIARHALNANNCSTTVEYLFQAATIAHSEGLLPHINAGTLTNEQLASLRAVSVSMGLMLESIRPDLPCHVGAPDKLPARRLETLAAAGALHIPMTTGLLVGIGDDESDRIAGLEAIAKIHESYGNIQEVIIQNFLPKPGTRMFKAAPPTRETYLRTIALARLILPDSVHLQAPPNLSETISDLLEAGIDDLGGISNVTIDHINPDRPWPELSALQATLEELGFDLSPRLPIYPNFLHDQETWLDPAMRPIVVANRNRDGYGRELVWFSGEPTQLNLTRLYRRTVTRRTPTWIQEIKACTAADEPVPAEHLGLALEARGQHAQLVIDLANELRYQLHGDRVTFVANRNINYTNICTYRCRFCAFSKGPLSLNLRGTPYLLDTAAILDKVAQATEVGATEVCLQGGIHPDFDGRYYLALTEAIHNRFPNIHIHAFSALEVFTGAKRLGLKLATYLAELKDRGLKSLPGTAAEILNDDVRAIICPDKLSSDEWLDVHESAHEVGLRSNVTIMFGSVENTRQTVDHLIRTRDLALRTRGFTEFVPLPFVHMATPLFLSGKARRGPTLREAVLMHAVGRIAYFGSIDNIQASWVKMGANGASLLLRSGANDLGGTLMEESISHAAGASHASSLERNELAQIANDAGRTLFQRSTFYEILDPPTAANFRSQHTPTLIGRR
ncbi:MAG: 5-amino-6-(D-ribitylamino)uracil--L-tyrosine 4-hydroxyphenyl transferase CofH [Ferrimicrobium sp.]